MCVDSRTTRKVGLSLRFDFQESVNEQTKCKPWKLRSHKASKLHANSLTLHYRKFFYDSPSQEEAVRLKTLVANLGIQRQSFLRWISTFLTWYSLSALALFDLLSFLN